MHRRQFLSASAAVSVGLGADSQFPSHSPTIRRNRPGDPQWPSDAQWSQLGSRLSGALIAVPAFITPCNSPEPGSECQTLVDNVQNPFYIGDQPGGTQVTGWLNAWTPAPSAKAIRARNAADVAAGVSFAREHKLRLVVKGAGHSYQGTSNAPDSLLIWTRSMTGVQLHDAFQPAGMEGLVEPCAAVTAEAGCMWIDLYHAVTEKAGRYVQGGGCTDVGVVGLVLSGGFGSFSKGYGLAASHLLEAEVVTADGRIRTVNEASDPDLFWALKGGGGGVWGVVTKVTLRTHALPEYLGSAWGEIAASSDADYRQLIERFLAHYQAHLFNPHWGEQIRFSPDNKLRISMNCQGLTGPQSRSAWLQFFDWARRTPGIEIIAEVGAGVMEARQWWSVEANQSLVRDPRPGSPAHHAWWRGDQGQANAFLHAYESLWLHEQFLEPMHRPTLAGAIFEASRHHRVSLHFNKGLAGAPPHALEAARNCACHPDATTAFALAIISANEGPVFPEVGRNADLEEGARNVASVARATAALRQMAPTAGSYVAESSYFQPDWQRAYWGANHARLAAIKDRYDSDGLFFSHQGVGSERWSRDGFNRI